MIVKFKPREDLYKGKKKLSKNTAFYINTAKKCIRSTTGKDLYLLYSLEKKEVLYASVDTINVLMIEQPLIMGVDKKVDTLITQYDKAYKKITYELGLIKSEKLQDYDSIFTNINNKGA